MANTNYDECKSRKRSKMFDSELCAICQTTTETSVHRATVIGLRAFTAAARTRKDAVHDRVQEILDTPVSNTVELCWHPVCYRSYTSRNNLPIPDQQKEEPNDESACSNDHVKADTRSNATATDWKLCIICQRKSYKNNFRTCTISTEEMCKQLYEIGTRKNAQLLLRISNVNLVTKGAQYHRGCLCKYIIRTGKSSDTGAVSGKESETVYDEAFRSSAETIVDSTISKKTACEMSDLTKAFKAELRLKGVESADCYTTQHLKRRLQNHYQDRITFAKPSQRNKSEVVYGSHNEGDLIQPAVDINNNSQDVGQCKVKMESNVQGHIDDVSDAPVVMSANGDFASNGESVTNGYPGANDDPGMNCDLGTDGGFGTNDDSGTNDDPEANDDRGRNERPDVNETGDASKKTTIYHAAQIIKNDICTSKGIKIQPVDPADLTIDKTEAIIPDSLKNLLTVIICTDDDIVLDVDKRRICSIAQDIMNASSHARVKTPKHIGLGITMKHLTGSKEVINILNHMGHSSCYQDVQTADTSLAKEVISKSKDCGIVIPSNIVPGKFIQAAADNIDFSERTIDGLQTTHATSIVLYQERGDVTDRKKVPTSIHSNRQRSLGKRTSQDTTIGYIATAKRPPVTDFIHRKDASWYNTGSGNNRLDREWTLLRMIPHTTSYDNITLLNVESNANPQPQTIPGWSGFNSLLSPGLRVENTTTVGYCPLINAPPTDNETVYNVLKNLQKIMAYMQQQQTVITFDLAIYSRAKEIQWRRPDEFRDTVIRLGGFHIALNYLAVLGKVFADGGLCDVLTESSTYGPNTTDQLLMGRSYNRGVRAHKVMYEALMRLLWCNFLQYLQNKKGVDINEGGVREHLHDWRTCVESAVDGISLHFPDTANVMDTTHELFDEYIAIGIASSQTFQFWVMYLLMVEILLAYIRAERNGNWTDHLDTVCRMMPYFLAMDRQNYGRWLPVYVGDMRMLPSTYPVVHEELVHNHAVARSTQSFSRVWTDQALEQTLNKDTKKKGGGLIGMTKKEEAVDRWCIAYHERAAVVQATKTMFGVTGSATKHHDLSKTTISRDESAVREVVKVFKSGLAVNPFTTEDQGQDDNPLPLTNLITGTTLPQNVAKRVLEIKDIGEEKLKDFVEKRLDSNQVLFWDPLKNSKIDTFSTIKHATLTKAVQEKKVPISDRNLLGRLLILSSNRKIRKDEVLSHELTTVPLALAYPDGSLRKTNKSDLLAELERKTEAFTSLPEPRDLHTTAVMVDAMALVQTVKTTGITTFGDFSDRCATSILSNFAVKQCKRIDVIFDRYDNEQSVKSGERARRGKLRSSLEIKIKGPMTPLPKRWSDFLSNAKNKINLGIFLTEQWKERLARELDMEKEVRIAGGHANPELCVQITSRSVIQNSDLSSNHEEADTRLLLHAQDASRDHKEIVINSPDTDVAILCVHFMPQLQCDRLWFFTGTRERKRYIPIHTLANVIGSGMCQVMPAIHALSGCDTTSSIRSVSKKKALSTLEKQGIDKLSHLGDCVPLIDDTRSKCEAFICDMYHTGKGMCYQTCDKLRYDTFIHKTQNSENLPPTSDSINQHIFRSNYQCYIWKQSLVPMMDMKEPVGNGWVVDDGKLCPMLMTKTPAPRGMIELTVCHCEKSQCQTRCSCKSNGLQCTDACKCSMGNYCKNPTILTNDTDDESDTDDQDV